MKLQKPCSCCKAELDSAKVIWIKQLQITETVLLKLYNCPHCKSTQAVKVIRQAHSQATTLFDRELI